MLINSKLRIALVLSVCLLPELAGARELTDILQEKGILTESEAAEAAPDSHNLRVFWKDGIRLESAGGDFALKLGGRLHNDWAAAFSSESLRGDYDDVSETDTGVSLRRARIAISGTIYQSVVFKADYDFAGGDADFKDVYVGLVGLPGVGSLTIGHFKEPFSLEEIVSSNHVTFLERGLPNAFAPSRNTGIMLANAVADERATWAVGAFRDTDDYANGFGDDSLYNLTGRITGLPIYGDDGAQLAHVGFSYSHQFRNDDDVRFRSRPESSLYPARLVDSTAIVGDGVDLIAQEAAVVYGPLSLQGEYFETWVNAAGDNPRWHGYYAFVSYFLTGESRTYETDKGIFGRTRPSRNFAIDGSGWGAWEIALRYSNLDVEQEGNELDDITLGANWYLNPNARVMLNYVHGDVDGSGDTHILQSRFQVDF